MLDLEKPARTAAGDEADYVSSVVTRRGVRYLWVVTRNADDTQYPLLTDENGNQDPNMPSARLVQTLPEAWWNVYRAPDGKLFYGNRGHETKDEALARAGVPLDWGSLKPGDTDRFGFMYVGPARVG